MTGASDNQLARLIPSADVRTYIGDKTFSEKQMAFLVASTYVREIAYVGAAQSGKSDAAEAVALMYVNIPDYACLIMRRNLKDLQQPNGMLSNMLRNLSKFPEVKYNDKTHTFTFPSGARIVFGHVDEKRGWEDYLGAEYQTIIYDEVVTMPMRAIQEINGRCRRTKNNPVRLCTIYLSNPGGGMVHDWIVEDFIEHVNDDERLYIPAKLEDNPFVDVEEYDRTLKRSVPYKRYLQLRFGDWSVTASGGIFMADEFKVIAKNKEKHWLDQVIRTGRGWDFAATEGGGDYTVGFLIGRLPKDRWIIMDVIRGQWEPSNVMKEVHKANTTDSKATLYLLEQERGASGVSWYDRLMRGPCYGRGNVIPVLPDGNKEERAFPFATAVNEGRVLMLDREWTRTVKNEFGFFGTKDGSEGKDDIIDAATVVFNYMDTPSVRVSIL